MSSTLSTSLPLLPSLACFGIVAVFWWPAWRCLRLQGLSYSLPTDVGLAFVFAFGVYAAITCPFLLLHLSADSALVCVLSFWLAWILITEYLWRKNPQSPHSACRNPLESNWQVPSFPWKLSLAGGFALSALTASEIIDRTIGLLLMAGIGFAHVVLGMRKQESRSGVVPQSKQSRLIYGLLIVLTLYAIISPFFFYRTDADDNLYLSEALVLQHSPHLGLYAPTHRGEALPSNPIYAWQSFELWAAMLARLSGLHPMIVMRSLLGPLLTLFSLCLYAGVLRLLIPRQWIPTAMVFILAYFLFGMSSQWTPNNYLLPRPQQGKTWLMHLGILALVLQSFYYFQQSSRRRWLGVFLVSFACAGWAPTAIALVPATLGSYACAHFLRSRNRDTCKQSILLLIGSIPVFLLALYLATHQSAIFAEESLASSEFLNWQNLFFFLYLGGGHGGGGLELAAMVGAPLLLLFFVRKRAWVYPLSFSFILGASLLNPILYPWARAACGGMWGYLRLYWLLPIPIFLACLGAFWVHTRRNHSSTSMNQSISLCIGLLVFPLCGAKLVWSSANIYSPPQEGIAIYRVENPYKIPAGLFEIAQRLQTMPLGPDHRILCHLTESMHLAPLVEDFDFVFAREYQTPPALHALGRVDEAKRRQDLAFDFLFGNMEIQRARSLLKQEKATYVILNKETKSVGDLLLALGYQERMAREGFSLWMKP